MSLFKNKPKPPRFFNPRMSDDERNYWYEDELTDLRNTVFMLQKELEATPDYEHPFIGPERAPVYGPNRSWRMSQEIERKMWADIQREQMKGILNIIGSAPDETKQIIIKKQQATIQMNRGE